MLITSKTMDDYRNLPTIKFCADLFPAHKCPSTFFRKGLTRERELIKPFNFFTFRQIKWTVCKKWKRNSEKFQLLIKSLLMVENKIFSKRRRFQIKPCVSCFYSHLLHGIPRPQVFSVKGALTCNFTALLTTSVDLIVKFFQSWSTVAGYGELCVCF